MRDYHVWEVSQYAQVRWHGGAQVNEYTKRRDYDDYPIGQWRENDVWSLAEWWETKPTLAEVDKAVREHYA